MTVRCDLSIRDYHLKLEESCTYVSISEANAITREDLDQRIVATFDEAITYLRRAYNLLNFPYKKHFACLSYKESVKKFRENNSNPEDIKKYKEELKQSLCSEFSALSSPDLKIKDFSELKNLSLSFIALDKKKGQLFLVLPHQIPNEMPEEKVRIRSPQEKWVYYYNKIARFVGINMLIKVNITESPSLEDWKIVHDNLGGSNTISSLYMTHDPFSEEKIPIEGQKVKINLSSYNVKSDFKDASISEIQVRDLGPDQVHLTVASASERLEFISDDFLSPNALKTNGCYIIPKKV